MSYYGPPRSLESQLEEMFDAMAKDICGSRSDYPKEVFKAYLRNQLQEAEERGKQDQGSEVIYQCSPKYGRDAGVWFDIKEKMYNKYKEAPSYMEVRAIDKNHNRSTEDALVKENQKLKERIGKMMNGSATKTIHSPARFIDGKLA